MNNVKNFKIVFAVVGIVAIFFSGCAEKRVVSPEEVPYETREEEIERIDEETKQKIESILYRVEEIARENPLEYVGKNTMSEAVEIMDTGPQTAPILIGWLKGTRNWKMRFWIVDMLGYVGGVDNILPLIEVIENPDENIHVRLRACESIKELKYRSAIDYLVVSRDIVDNINVKRKIEEVIEFLR